MAAPAQAEPSTAQNKSVLRRGMVLIREYVALHPGPFIIAVSGAVLFAGALVASSWVLGQVVDRVVTVTFETGELPASALAWGAAAILAITVLRIVGVVCRRYFAGMTSERVQVTFRGQLTDRFLGLPLSWHQATPTGELLAISDTDTERAVELIHPLPFSLGAICIAAFSLGLLVTIDPYVTLIALAVFPALGLINNYYGSRVEAPSAAGQQAVGQVSTIAHESFEGALVVKTLGRAGAEGDRFDEASRELRDHRVTVGYLRAVFEPVLDVIPSLGIFAAILVSAYRVSAGAMTIGEMITVTSLFSVLGFPVRVFGYFLESVPPSLVSRQRLTLVLNEEVPAPPTPVGFDGFEPLGLMMTDVGFAYPATAESPPDRVLDDVSFDVEPGQVVALVGSTGSGKSTLCRLMAGLIEPDRGHVLAYTGDGSDASSVARLGRLERTGAISLVFQESFMFADTIEANIDTGSDGSASQVSQRVREAAALAEVDSFIHELPDGYNTSLGERGVNLSGGQRQRVALARALVRKPRFLILDDATSAVDPKIEQAILAGLREELNTTTFVVAQRVATIALADTVLYLSGGRVAAAGTHEQLMANPGYEALVRAYELGAA